MERNQSMQGMNLSLCVRRNWDKGHKLIIKRKSSWPFLTTISSIFSTISSLNILHDDSKKKGEIRSQKVLLYHLGGTKKLSIIMRYYLLLVTYGISLLTLSKAVKGLSWMYCIGGDALSHI